MKIIDGKNFLEMVVGGAKYLAYQRKLVDSLNVFPVPDGDTGTNMTLTMSSAVKESEQADVQSIADVALKVSKGALRGARGNSGVILSQIIKGFAVAFEGKETASAYDFSEALKIGTEIAYGAVTKPKEGTILTVIRVMAESAYAYVKRNKNADILTLLDIVLREGGIILDKTPEMLPVLKKANVVDAGGKGLLSIFIGFKLVLNGEEIPEGDDEEEAHEEEKPTLKAFADDHSEESINFGYCTEFFVTNLKKRATVADIDKFRDSLMEIGDCVLVIGDLQFVKVHVHTDQPDKALRLALRLGEIDNIKIENMVQQNRELRAKAVGQEAENADEETEKKEAALISICAGAGFKAIFEDLGVDEVVEGGQTMNPSVYDILNAINRVGAKTVYVFPNNSNIILAANQAKELAESEVVVLPTKNVPQGIAAVLAYMPEATVQENVQNMTDSMARIKTGQVTHAVRNTRMNGFHVKEGDIIGLNGKDIVARGRDVESVVLSTIGKLAAPDDEMVTLYYGQDIDEAAAEGVAAKVQEKFPDVEVMAYSGGQPHYYFMLSIE